MLPCHARLTVREPLGAGWNGSLRSSVLVAPVADRIIAFVALDKEAVAVLRW